jgi:hypothetical protein
MTYPRIQSRLKTKVKGEGRVLHVCHSEDWWPPMQSLETADIVFLNGNPFAEELCDLLVDDPRCFHARAQDFDDVQRRQRQQGLGILRLGQAELAQGRRIGRGIRGDIGAGHGGGGRRDWMGTHGRPRRKGGKVRWEEEGGRANGFAGGGIK